MRHEVFLADRGGRDENIIEKLEGLRLVRWNRTRDAVSECEVVVQGAGKYVQQCLRRDGLSMRHELVIKRDGVRVWEGPIIRPHLQGNVARIFCRDVLLFAQRTYLTQRWSSAFADGGPEFVTARAKRIITGEWAVWAGWDTNFLEHIVVRQNAETAKTTKVAALGSVYVWDDMDDMAAHSGLDYTVANRSLYLFDTHQFLGMGRRLTDADFLAELEVVEYGLELATRSAVTDGQGRIGVSTTDDDYYGPFGLLASSYSAPTDTAVPQSELDEQAVRNARSRYPAPVLLRVPENTRLKPDIVGEVMPWLIPGNGFPVYSDSTGRIVEQVQKLDHVSFEETSKGETVKVTLSAAPVGSGVEDVEDG